MGPFQPCSGSRTRAYQGKTFKTNGLGLEAPPGFEPGMEVLQGHPRLFRPDPHFASPPRKSHLLNQMRRLPHKRHRVWRWLKLAGLRSSRAQFGHSSSLVPPNLRCIGLSETNDPVLKRDLVGSGPAFVDE
jgi:hypothetical protein